MRVLFLSRATLFDAPGGDTVQVMKTAEALRRFYRIQVDIPSQHNSIDYEQYDLIHFFNVTRPNAILEHLRCSKKPYVVSPIFVDYSEAELHSGSRFRRAMITCLGANRMEYVKVAARALVGSEKLGSLEYLARGHGGSIQKVLDGSGAILANSKNEAKRLSRHFFIDTAKIQVVPNAVDKAFKKICPEILRDFESYKDAVLCVGRIEELKNQLSLIRALRDTHLNLVIVGSPGKNSRSYYKKCVSEAGSRVRFIGHLSHDTLPYVYANAKVHALPSWFETTGLVNLEAGLCGCNLVATRKGDQEEYLGEFPYYCSPDELGSIRNAVLSAYTAPRNRLLAQVILSNFTWEKAARETFKAYSAVLNNSRA